MSKTFDRYASFVFFALGAAFVTESMRISTSAYGSNVGPNIFPMGLGIVLLLLSLRLFYETFRYSGSKDKKPTLNYKNFLIILGTTFLYALFMEQIGYVISTFLFLIIGFQVMEKGGWLKSIIISAAFSFGVYYLFVVVLQGTLPGFPAWFS